MIYLLRHGRAVADADGSDDCRWLSAAGRAEARAVGAALRDRGIQVETIVSSPLVRAVQTAELAAAELGYAGELVIRPQLRHEASASSAALELSTFGPGVLAVSHEPLVSALCAQLTGVRGPFRTAELRAIDDTGALLWRQLP